MHNIENKLIKDTVVMKSEFYNLNINRMDRKIKLMPKGDYQYFQSLSNDEKLYCVSDKVHKENESIFGSSIGPYEVPDDMTVKAFPLEKVGADQIYDHFDIVTKEPIDFRVNQIRWVWVSSDPNL